MCVTLCVCTQFDCLNLEAIDQCFLFNATLFIFLIHLFSGSPCYSVFQLISSHNMVSIFFKAPKEEDSIQFSLGFSHSFMSDFMTP